MDIKNIKFATPEDIIQPKSTVLIPQERGPKDHVYGASVPFDLICADKDWMKYVWPDVEIQVLRDGDNYCCVTYSRNSCFRFIHTCRYNEDFNISERFAALIGGTKRGVGASPKRVAEATRLKGFLYQKECPTPDTLDAFFAPLTKLNFDLASVNLNDYDIGYKFLPDNLVDTIESALQYSPVQVSVEPYTFNSKGYLINSNLGYTHEVDICKKLAENGSWCWVVFDSESRQWIKFDKSYRFGSPIIHNLKKKYMPKILNHPMIKHGKDIYALAQSGDYVGKYIRIFSSPTFKSLYGDFDPKKYIPVQDLPDNMAVDENNSTQTVIICPDSYLFGPGNEVLVNSEGLTSYLKGLSSANEEQQ